MTTISKLVFSKINSCIERIKVSSHRPLSLEKINHDWLDKVLTRVQHLNRNEI